MNNFDTAFKKVCELVEDFKKNEQHYLSSAYQEADVRRDYIDKFFEALGWDVYHNIQKDPSKQEVKVERPVNVGRAQKRADYAFSVFPNFKEPKFFVEAKKPSRNLRNPDDYFQTIRYGWNANTPVAVLTDFEEFHILDCRFKPDIDYVLQNQNHKIYKYSDYVDEQKFAGIYFMFSRDSVADGSLQKYSDGLPKPKGKATQWGLFRGEVKPIDEDFLDYINDVRSTLAKAFKKNDPSLDSEQLTEVTQKTVDRLVFIRFLEDKLIEPEYYISELGKKNSPWREFINLCKKLDAKYNGIVFKTTKIDEQKFNGPEEVEFLRICEEISHLNSPYDFHYIPIHILGSIYEQFLGKIVKLKGRGVTIEDKPEVRKAGGVYYTPKYIVDYIVQNTIGKLIENKTPEEISEMRFADIACGSGSFLIGVYELLLEYHKNYYQSNIKKAEKDGCIINDGLVSLSLNQKQNILLNNIYGVDIDNQAVEVTQLSLALKMLEDESTFTTRQMEMEFHKKIIPESLSKNIVCGNSLIGTDILEGNLFGEVSGGITMEEERKLKPMDFETVFPKVFKPKSSQSKTPLNPNTPVIPADFKPESTQIYGFDAIVGNPPYRTLLLGKKQDSEEDSIIIYYSSKYPNSSCYKVNLFALFIEKSLKLLNKDSLFSYIIPNSFFNAFYFKDLRNLLLNNGGFFNICDLRYKVFKDAELGGSGIFVYSKGACKPKTSIISADNESLFLNPKKEIFNSDDFLKNINYNLTFTKGLHDIIEKINKQNIVTLEKITKIYQGIITGDNKKYILNYQKNSKWQKILKGRDINRYQLIFDNNYVYYSPKDLWSNTDINMFKVKNKIISRQTSDKLIATLDNEGYFSLDSTHVIHLIVDSISIKYLLGVYNSKLINFLYQNNVKESGRVFAQVKVVNLKPLPIKEINFQNPSEKQSHDIIVSLVDRMLEAKKLLNQSKTDNDKNYLQRRCEDLDSQIDTEVYKLYGLTDEEINIVEGK